MSETTGLVVLPEDVANALAAETRIQRVELTGSYIPGENVDQRFLVDENREQRLRQGRARRHGLRAGGVDRTGTVRVFGAEAIDGVVGAARFDWGALDARYQEDEQVFVHLRNAYVRVEAFRSHRHVQVSLEGITLAEGATPVLVFEAGLPRRYYFDRTAVDFGHLVPVGMPHTRVSPAATGRCGQLTKCAKATRFSPGHITSLPVSCCPSPAWSPSTTRRSTSTWTECGCPGPEPTSSGNQPLLPQLALITNA